MVERSSLRTCPKQVDGIERAHNGERFRQPLRVVLREALEFGGEMPLHLFNVERRCSLEILFQDLFEGGSRLSDAPHGRGRVVEGEALFDKPGHSLGERADTRVGHIPDGFRGRGTDARQRPGTTRRDRRSTGRRCGATHPNATATVLTEGRRSPLAVQFQHGVHDPFAVAAPPSAPPVVVDNVGDVIQIVGFAHQANNQSSGLEALH